MRKDTSFYSVLIDEMNLILSELNSATGDSGSVEPRYYYNDVSGGDYGSMTMQITSTSVIYDLKKLINVIAGMIAEFSMLCIDLKTQTTLLKNTNIVGTYSLDMVRSVLPQFNAVKCVSVCDGKLVFTFKDPLDIDGILQILTEPDTRIGDLKVEKRVERGINKCFVVLNGLELFCLSGYGIGLSLNGIIEIGTEVVQMLAEIIIRVHMDILFRNDIQRVDMHRYCPFFKLMEPALFADQISPIIIETREIMNKGKIRMEKVFVETKSSGLYNKNDKRYRLNFDIPRLKYLIACPDKQEIYLGFEPFLDMVAIKNFFSGRFTVKEKKERGEEKSVIIKKGGGRRHVNMSKSITSYDFFDQREKLVATINGRSVIVIRTDDDNCFNQGLEIFCGIYFNWLFYTSWIPTAEIPNSDLTEEERLVIKNVDLLYKLYSTFLSVILGREFAQEIQDGKDAKMLTDKEWLVQFLQNDPGANYQEKILNLLLYIKGKTDLYVFLRETPGSSEADVEIRNRITKLYDSMNNQIAVTISYLNGLK